MMIMNIVIIIIIIIIISIIIIIIITIVMIRMFIHHLLNALVGYLMRLFELGVRDSFDLWDSVWVLILSITTVGYGDLYPKSDLGRTVLICNQLVGVVILSTLVAVVQQSLSLSNRCEHIAYPTQP